MGRNTVKLYGEALGLARQLAHNPSPEVVRRINGQYPHFAPRILGTLSVEQQMAHGLSVNKHGRLIIAAAQQSEAQAAHDCESAPSTPLEIARALNRAKPASTLATSRQPMLYATAYGKAVTPDRITRVWNNTASATDRVGIMRRATTIGQAEVSTIAHSGNYSQVIGDAAVIAKHAGKLLRALCAPAPSREPIRWELYTADTTPTYTMSFQQMGDDSPEEVPVLVRRQTFGEAVETGAILAIFGQDNERYQSPGRTFSVTGNTAFSVDGDLASELMVGAEVQPGSPLTLSGDAVAVVDDFIATGDAAILAPAYTSFVVDQRLGESPN